MGAEVAAWVGAEVGACVGAAVAGAELELEYLFGQTNSIILLKEKRVDLGV